MLASFAGDRLKSTEHSGKLHECLNLLVQRGVVSFGLSHRVRKARRLFREPWLSKPSAVNGTKAKDLFPGIRTGTPEELQLVNLHQMRKLMAHTSTFTHMPLGDQASSNVLMMKYEGHFWESHLLPAFGGRILLWPDHCAVHAHHNGQKGSQGDESAYVATFLDCWADERSKLPGCLRSVGRYRREEASSASGFASAGCSHASCRRRSADRLQR